MAQNAIVGDSFGTELPKTKVDEELLNNEKRLAKYSRTKEFQALKAYLEDRIKFFETFLPSGKEVRFEADTNLGIQWVVANNVIAEFRAVLGRYEQANEVVKMAEENVRR